MLKKVIKLNAEQYENLYKGNLVVSGDSQNTLKLNLETLTLAVNNTILLLRSEYLLDISDKYLELSYVDELFNLNIIDVYEPLVLDDSIIMAAANGEMLKTADNKYLALEGE